jgi:hypothetical protein
LAFLLPTPQLANDEAEAGAGRFVGATNIERDTFADASQSAGIISPCSSYVNDISKRKAG